MKIWLVDCVLILMSICFSFAAACNLYPHKIKKVLLSFVLLAVFVCSILFGMSYPFIVPIFTLMASSGLLYFHGKRLFISILCSVLGLLIIFALDLISTNLIKLLFRDLENLYSSQEISLLSIPIIGFVGYVISLLIGKYVRKKLIPDQFHNISLIDKTLTAVLLIYSYTLLVLNVNLLLAKGYDASTVILFSGLFVGYVGLVALILLRVARNARLKMELSLKNKDIAHKEKSLERLREYTSEVEYLYGNMRVFRHDYINLLSSMYGYMENKDWETLETYFKKKILPVGREMDNNSYKLGLLKNLKVTELKGLLSAKALYAQEKGIDFLIDVAEETDIIKMDILDLCTSVGILLDNAIEASLESEEMYAECSIVNKESSVLIVVRNSYNGKRIDIRKIFEKGFSTKTVVDQDRGVGLYTLKRIIGANPNIQIDTDITLKEFKIILEIQK